LRFRDHTQGRTTVGRTPLVEWSARRRALYLRTHTTLTTDKRPCPRRDSETTLRPLITQKTEELSSVILFATNPRLEFSVSVKTISCHCDQSLCQGHLWNLKTNCNKVNERSVLKTRFTFNCSFINTGEIGIFRMRETVSTASLPMC
jgi:hypothetical protein